MHAGSTVNNSTLMEFARGALDFAREAVCDVPALNRTNIVVGGSVVQYAESTAFLKPDVERCFTTVPVGTRNKPDFTVYGDYSGWHLGNGFANPHSEQDDMLAICRALDAVDIQVSYYAPLQRWEFFDRSDGFGVRLQCGIKGSPEWESTAPLANFCNWAGAGLGNVMLHAASVGTRKAGALLIGDGGTGKSGTTLGAMLEGMLSAGDDYVMVSPGPNYRALAVYASVKQDPKGLRRLGLAYNGPLNWQGKAVCRAEELTGQEISSSVAISALIMPKIGATKTAFEPISPSEVFKTLTFSTLKQLGSDHREVFKACAALVRAYPCFSMHMSANNREISENLTQFLENL